MLQDEWLAQVNVHTSSWYTGANMARAKNRGELRELLVQTSFIPFATGFGFNHEGSYDCGYEVGFQEEEAKRAAGAVLI